MDTSSSGVGGPRSSRRRQSATGEPLRQGGRRAEWGSGGVSRTRSSDDITASSPHVREGGGKKGAGARPKATGPSIPAGMREEIAKDAELRKADMMRQATAKYKNACQDHKKGIKKEVSKKIMDSARREFETWDNLRGDDLLNFHMSGYDDPRKWMKAKEISLKKSQQVQVTLMVAEE
jgi:hypothetical protein